MIIFNYVRYELIRFFRNPRLVLIFLLSPLLATTVFAIVAYQSPHNISTGIINQQETDSSQKYFQAIESIDILKIRKVYSQNEGEKLLKEGQIKSLITIAVQDGKGSIHLLEDPRYPEIAGKVRQEVATAIEEDLKENVVQTAQETAQEKYLEIIDSKISDFEEEVLSSSSNNPLIQSLKEKIDRLKEDLKADSPAIKINAEPIVFENSENLPKDIKYFDRYSSGAIPLVIVLIFLLKAATSISQDREEGILERLFSTPISKKEIIASKIISNILVGLISSTTIVLVLKLIFKTALGNIGLVFLVAFLTAITSVTLGILISTLTKDLPSTIQFSFYTFFIIVLTSEFFFAQENIHPVFKYVTKLNPLTYSVSALRKINLLNWGLAEIKWEILILSTIAVFYIILSILFMKEEAN